jgi:hypothetical protein
MTPLIAALAALNPFFVSLWLCVSKFDSHEDTKTQRKKNEKLGCLRRLEIVCAR